MADIETKTALRKDAATRSRIGRLVIEDLPEVAITWVARRRGGDLRALEQELGFTMPAPGQMSGTNGVAAVCNGRDQWLLTAPWRADMDRALKAAAHGQVSVADQSDGWALFKVTGPRMEAFLSLLCNIDPADLSPGRALPTQMEHMRVIVARESDTSLALFAPRNMAISLHHALISAAQSLA